MNEIIIATVKSWNINLAIDFMSENRDRYKIQLVEDPDIFRTITSGLKDNWIFFPHWNWIVPREIWENNRCVGFHIGDLPYGRGGSPLQNLILRKLYYAKLTAFQIDGGIDTGPVYMKIPFWIGEGSAEELLKKASKLIFERMIPEILEKEIELVPQMGEILEFKRRTPGQSDLNLAGEKIEDIYDHIRMLDGEGYPKAFLAFSGRYKSKKILLSDAKLVDGKLSGRFEIE